MTTTGSVKKKRGRPRKWVITKRPLVPDIDLPPSEETDTAGGYDEALRGAGEEPEVDEAPPEGEPSNGETPPPQGQAPPQGPPPVDPVEIEALIGFCEMTTVITCRGFAISRGVAWTNELQRECLLSDMEKKQLAMTAPAAMPYIRTMMQHMEKIAAALFFLSYSFMLASKISVVKSKTPPKPPPPPKEMSSSIPGV